MTHIARQYNHVAVLSRDNKVVRVCTIDSDSISIVEQIKEAIRDTYPAGWAGELLTEELLTDSDFTIKAVSPDMGAAYWTWQKVKTV